VSPTSSAIFSRCWKVLSHRCACVRAVLRFVPAAIAISTAKLHGSGWTVTGFVPHRVEAGALARGLGFLGLGHIDLLLRQQNLSADMESINRRDEGRNEPGCC
jgi:hypothetical protein